ncbi:MAG TPA: amidohydrolase [Dermatophilaceae bacterium]|nr:amidohydrolase [Dermatophilaceae bacterium]
MAFRRDLHAHPELSHAEHRSTSRVAARLKEAGIRVRLLTGTGLIADLGPADPVYRVALRADLDALPLAERTGLAFASQFEGVCHACGHDVHVAAVLGAGLALHQHADSLAGLGLGVRLIFQPAEEITPGGALTVIAQGGLQGVDAIFSIHCDPTLDVGLVGLRDGPITSATDSVTVTLRGSGGHTSRPQVTQDLIYALGKVVTDVPAALSRRVDPRAGVLLVWGTIHAGSAENVIPSSGTVNGTLRMLDAQLWQEIGPLLEEVVHAVVLPYGVSATVAHVRGAPPVVNDPELVARMRSGARLMLGPEATTPTHQSLGGEDFAWYLQAVPGAMARLGTRTPGGATHDLHQGDLVVDDRAVTMGAGLLLGAALAHRSRDEK